MDSQFFYDNAGYSWDSQNGETQEQGRRRCAEALANAEYEAKQANWEVIWEYDQEPCSGCDCGESHCNCYTGAEHETFTALLTDGKGREAHHVLASLGSICEPTDEYRRVIEAELALEAL